MHVYLTRDRGVLRAASVLRPFGLLIGSPLDLLEELAAAGALFSLMDPNAAYWRPQDPERVVHLFHATFATEVRLGSAVLREIGN